MIKTLKTKDITLFLYALSILWLILSGAEAWFTWKVDQRASIYVCFFVALLYALNHKRQWLKFDVVTFGCLFLAYTMFYNRANYAIQSVIFALGFVVPFYILARCSQEHLRYIFNFCIKILCFILVPSIILQVIFLVIGFPHINPIEQGGSDNYLYYNYFFLVHNYVIDAYKIRFCSIFLEPGYAGSLFVFLLYANGMDLRDKYNKILTIALILTLSLAGYVTFILAWAFTAIQNGLFKRKYIIFGLLLVGIYYTGISYNGGDNVLNNYIFERLQINNEGKMEGDNRTTEAAQDYFDYLITSNLAWEGLGKQDVQDIEDEKAGVISGAGYMIYIIRYGLISCILVFMGYLLLGLERNKRYNMFFLTLMVLTFLQAAYPLSGSWLVPYIIGIFLHDNEKIST